MFAVGHRGGCCGINELRLITRGDLAEGLDGLLSCRHNIQYRAHCPNIHREWMEPELIAAGFTLLATNAGETVWGLVGKR